MNTSDRVAMELKIVDHAITMNRRFCRDHRISNWHQFVMCLNNQLTLSFAIHKEIA